MQHRPTLREGRPAVQAQASRLRGALALVAAVLVASVGASAMVTLAHDLPHFRRNPVALAFLVIAMAPFALPLLVLVGASTLAILFWRGWNGAAAYAAAGAVGGAVLACLGQIAFFGHVVFFSEQPLIRQLVTWYGAAGVAGLASALAFWVVYRPDRASEP